MALLSIQINHHAGTPKHNNYKMHDKIGYSSICYIGSKIGRVPMKEVYNLCGRYGDNMGKLTYSITPRFTVDEGKGQLNLSRDQN